MRARSATHTRGLLVGTATTASPVSGSDVRHKMLELAEETAKQWCANLLRKRFFQRRMKAPIEERIERLHALRREEEYTKERERAASKVQAARRGRAARQKVR